MTSTSTFAPDWTCPPPARTIADLLARKGLSLRELGAAAKLPSAELDLLMAGSKEIDAELAALIGGFLGGTQSFWLSRERQYRDSLQSEIEESLLHYLSRAAPIREMVRLGWLREFQRDDSVLNAVARFFGVHTKEEFLDRYEGLAANLSFRRSPSFDLELGPLAAWMRAAEHVAANANCAAWDAKKLRASLPALRELTLDRDPVEFVPKLTEICARAGVAVAIVRAPKGCPVSGATTFVSVDRALVALSFRHLTDDHFWFSFFHELGHLLLHGSRETILEHDDVRVSAIEAEANQFAAEVIVPSPYCDQLTDMRVSKFEIVRFARRIGVSPGLVVGQMQHRGMLRRNQLNFLKRRYAWR